MATSQQKLVTIYQQLKVGWCINIIILYRLTNYPGHGVKLPRMVTTHDNKRLYSYELTTSQVTESDSCSECIYTDYEGIVYSVTASTTR
jgi:hypothetical protein